MYHDINEKQNISVKMCLNPSPNKTIKKAIF